MMDKKDIRIAAQEIIKLLKVYGANYQDVIDILSIVNQEGHRNFAHKQSKKIGGER